MMGVLISTQFQERSISSDPNSDISLDPDPKGALSPSGVPEYSWGFGGRGTA